MVFSRKAAQEAWPEAKILQFEIRWLRRNERGRTAGRGGRMLFAPSIGEAVEGYNTVYPNRFVSDIRVV